MMNELKEKRKLYIDSVGKMEFESKEVKMQLFVISSRLLVVMPLIFRF
jgi:nucleoside-triphosphatase THEP1